MLAGPADRLVAAAALSARGRLMMLCGLLVIDAAATLSTPLLLTAALDAVLHRRPTVQPAVLLGLTVVAGGLAEAALAVVGAAAAGGSGRWLYARAMRHLLALSTGNAPTPG